MQRRPLFIIAFVVICLMAIGAGNAIRKATDPSVAGDRSVFASIGASIKGLVRARLGVHGADPMNAKLVTRGHELYSLHCAACHGPKLEGQPNWRVRKPDGTLPAPPHDASGHTWHHDDKVLFDYTKQGGQALMPEGVTSGMPGFEGVFSDADIWAVLSFIKSRWPEEIRQRQPKSG